MGHLGVRRLCSIVALFLSVSLLFAEEKRAALIIGNGAYTEIPKLNNPVNDAHDIAVVLKSLGFEVIERTDVDLEDMEQSLKSFKKLLPGLDVALFFYSGHGVQIQGENYLLPVGERFSSESTVRSRAVSVGQVLDIIRDAQVPTALIFLDACRDNPFTGWTRGGLRGLSVVKAPPKIETMISYATEPGETANDGSSRNSFFTSALLKSIQNPSYEIADLMRQVRADVMQATNGEQRPRIDIGLSKPFYFNLAHETVHPSIMSTEDKNSKPLQQVESQSESENNATYIQPKSQQSIVQNSPQSIPKGYFGLGSTKDEVIRAMGTPRGISVYASLGKETWSYSYSTIDFDRRGRVVGWDDVAKVLHLR